GPDWSGPTEQILRRLADLPVTVLKTSAKGHVDAGVVEGGERDGGASPDRRLVLQRPEHAVQGDPVADGTESGHRRLATQLVEMAPRHELESFDDAGTALRSR